MLRGLAVVTLLWIAMGRVGAAPISAEMRDVAIIESAMMLPNTTQTNNVTYFYQAEKAGACGWISRDYEIIAGLPLEFYNETGVISAYCGTYIVVQNPRTNGTITARIADASAENSTLSLSIGSWEALDGARSNLTVASWRFANKTEVAIVETQLLVAQLSTLSNNPSAFPASNEASIPSPSSAASTPAREQPQAQQDAPSPLSSPVPAPAVISAYTPPPAPAYTPTPAPAPAPVSAAASQAYSGSATYYYQEGNSGACGKVNSDSAYIIAIPTAMYSPSNCGREVTITRSSTGESIKAVVADMCPGCSNSGSIDLSSAAFEALASKSVGRFDVNWAWA